METLDTFLNAIIGPWKSIRRWQGKPDVKLENDLMHSWKTAMQAFVLLTIERELSKKINDLELQILVLALIHDISEACLGGDVIAPIKNDPRLGGSVDLVEAELFDQFVSELPCQSAEFLRATNHLQGRCDLIEGRFFEMVELIGYSSFALAEIAAQKSAKNTEAFVAVLNNKHPRLIELMEEFKSVELIYGQFIPSVESGGVIMADNNLEHPLRKIIDAWDATMAWPGILVNETVLERVMKTALLSAIFIPLEVSIRKGKRQKAQLNGFDALACSIIYNIDKSMIGVLPFKLKSHPKFSYEGWYKIEAEKFSEAIADFPEPIKKSMQRIFRIRRNTKMLEGRLFSAIRHYSYLLFALAEYERGKTQFADVLRRCYPIFIECSKGFKCFDYFSSHQPLLYRIKSIIDGAPRL